MAAKLRLFGKATAAILKNILPPMVHQDELADAIGYVENAGAPSSVVPDFIGQRLFDTSNAVFYVAYGTSSGNWLLMGDAGLSAAEIDALDGATSANATTGKAAILGTNGAITLGGSVTAVGSFIIGAADMAEADLEKLDGITNGTQAANKAVVADTNVNTGVSKVTGLHIGASGAEVEVLATAAEINRATDVSTRIVVIVATGNITEALHEGKTCLLAEVGGDAAVTLTLPAATGGGGKYRFVVDVVNTAGYVIKAVSGADLFLGTIFGNDGAAVTTAWRWRSGTTDDTLTLNGTTTGGVFRGDWVEFEDTSTTCWAVRGAISQSGAEATPFSDTVA